MIFLYCFDDCCFVFQIQQRLYHHFSLHYLDSLAFHTIRTLVDLQMILYGFAQLFFEIFLFHFGTHLYQHQCPDFNKSLSLLPYNIQQIEIDFSKPIVMKPFLVL